MANSHVVVGSGATRVIALHGWFGSARGWGSLPAYLDTERFSYAFMDCRGYGGSIDVAGQFTMDEIAADTLTLADELGWGEFDLVGHSMGGVAVQRVLVEAPERVRRMVALAGVPASGIPFDEDSWALFSGAPDSMDNRQTIIDFTTGNRLTKTWVEQVAQHSLANSSRDAFAAYLPAWGKTDFVEQVKGRGTPVKLVVGEHDPGLSAALMRQTWLQWYPNAELEVMANAGHYPMFETPVALATSIEGFLGQPTGRARRRTT